MLISRFDSTNIAELISEYEAKNKFAFPDQYREFLLKYNGGDTPKTKFKIGRIASDLRGFYGLGNAGEFLNYRVFDSMGRIDDFLEDEMLPIGKNVFGDFVTIGVGKDNNGRVFFTYHDRPKKYFELTGDFKAFVGKCKSEQVGHIRTIEERRVSYTKKLGEEPSKETVGLWQAEIDEKANKHQEELLL